ncbi:MAG: DUF2809 domain-containing protein [Bryobacteraceae bacterium]
MYDRRAWKVRVQLVSIAFISVLAGLWLRFDAPIPPYLRDVCGGLTYVLFFILVILAFRLRASAFLVAAAVLVVTCSLEFLQLWHPVWLEACRRTIPGRLLLGTTFEWTDFPPYFVGAAGGWLLLRTLNRVDR